MIKSKELIFPISIISNIKENEYLFYDYHIFFYLSSQPLTHLCIIQQNDMIVESPDHG